MIETMKLTIEEELKFYRGFDIFEEGGVYSVTAINGTDKILYETSTEKDALRWIDCLIAWIYN